MSKGSLSINDEILINELFRNTVFKKVSVNKVLWGGVWFMFCVALEASVSVTALPSIQDELEFRDIVYSLLFALFHFSNVIFGIWVGNKIIQYPPYLIMSYIGIIVIVSNIGFAIANHWTVCLVLVIFKAFYASTWMIVAALLDFYAESENRAYWIGIFGGVSGLGGLCGAMLGTMLYWRVAYIVSACIQIPWCLFHYWIDGPTALPTTFGKQVDGVISRIKPMFRDRRALWTCIGCAFPDAIMTSQLSFGIKFCKDVFSWEDSKTTMVVGACYIIGFMSGKLGGSKTLDIVKNNKGLENPNSPRDELFYVSMFLTHVSFIGFAVLQTFMWWFGVWVMIIGFAFLSFTVSFAPKLNVKIWAVSLSPYLTFFLLTRYATLE
eukprot:UN06603